jgi:sporulation protein YlmC with PRC-barrel domain
MYRKLLATTALSLVLTGGVMAQDMMAPPADPTMDAPAAAPEVPQEPLVQASDLGINADGWLATELMGEDIYNSTADDAENIGEVNDFVLDREGGIAAVVVGVGGFLGIGQKNVAIAWDDLELVVDADGENRLVANMTREQLEAAADFDRAEWLASEQANAAATDIDAAPAPMDAPADPAAPADATAPADAEMDADADAQLEAETPATDVDADAQLEAETPVVDAEADAAADVEAPAATPAAPAADAPAAGADATTGAVVWDDYETVVTTDLTADELTGTTVYGAGDEDIGDIGDIVLTEDGSIEAVVIDFGGFLGIATKPVAVSFDELELDAAPEYDPETYVDARDDQLFYSNR